MVTRAQLGRIGLALALMATITACTQSADRMSGAALPQDAPPAASDVDAGSVASEPLGTLPDAAVLAPAPGATSESEAANPWGALAVPADQAASAASAEPAVADGIVGLDATNAGDAAAAQPDAARAITAGLPSTGSPAACKSLLTPIDEALKYGGSLTLAVTMMPANGSYVGYAEGEVKRVAKPVAAGSPARFALEGKMWQQFSDRIVPKGLTKCAGPCPTPSGPTMPSRMQRFNEDRLDKLGVSMDVATGNTTLTLYSWDNAIVRLTPTCENGMFYGYADGKLYAMTGRLTRPIPTPGPKPFP